MNKRKEKRFRTDILFSVPDYLIGAGTILNIAGNYYEFNYSSSGEEADLKAAESDWGVIGQDMRDAFNEYESCNSMLNG